MILVYVRFTGNQGRPSEAVPGAVTSRHVIDTNDPDDAARLAYAEVQLLHQQAGHPEITMSGAPFDWRKAKGRTK